MFLLKLVWIVRGIEKNQPRLGGLKTFGGKKSDENFFW